MSIASEITRINGNIAAAYTALDGKGATLPEVQNSANLADTIDTISTGGGGNADYQQDLNTMISTLDDDLSNGLTTNNFSNFGYTRIATGNTARWRGYVVGKNYDYIYVSKDWYNIIKIPSTATIEESTNNFYKITFGSSDNAHWIIANGGKDDLFDGVHLICSMQAAGGSNAYNIAELKCLYDTSKTGTLNVTDIFGMYMRQYAANLKILKFKNSITFNDNTSSEYALRSALGRLFLLDNSAELFSYFNGFSNGVYRFSASYIYNLFQRKTNIVPYMKDGEPIIFDFTNVTESGTFKMFDSGNFYPVPKVTVTDLKIVLPSTYTTVDMQIVAPDSQYVGIPFSPEALSFMATNAPTVTSATLKLGYREYCYLNYTTAGQAIKTVFNNKGWALSYS